jgi:hypothetical protein
MIPWAEDPNHSGSVTVRGGHMNTTPMECGFSGHPTRKNHSPNPDSPWVKIQSVNQALTLLNGKGKFLSQSLDRLKLFPMIIFD